MCRISGIISPPHPIEALQPMVKEMCRIQEHGGPDDEGMYTDAAQHLVLGHRRLSLIELSMAGHQPMSYSDGRYTISYNGELYNYLEIRMELMGAGFKFNTNSDTEVILAAFAAWGCNAFHRFNGMFAFAIYDKQVGEIYLVRDTSGIKPLYYAVTDEGLAFASEIKAFAAIPWLQKKNENWPVYLLAYGHLPEPITTLADVKPLPKGCCLRYRLADKDADLNVYSFYSYREQLSNRADVAAAIRETLQESVKRHLISDAPIGVFLSGGLDSSIIASLAGKFHHAGLKTLSIVFDEAEYSEKKYQDLMIQKLNCPNWQSTLSEKEFQQNFNNILQAMDMPGCDGMNTWFISKYAKESGLKAVLSGVGGDELFGGYPSFSRINLVKRLDTIPTALLRAGKHANTKKIRRLAFLSLRGAKGAYLFLRGQFIPATIARQLDMDEKQVWNLLEDQPDLYDISSLQPGNEASWIETNLYMQNQLLRDSDVMSMAHGIEIRVPFLDKEFMSLALSIRSTLKYSGTLPKQLLVDSFKSELPEPIWNRPKMGFTFPFAEWLGKNDYVKETMLGKNARSAKNYQQFLKGEMHWSQLMALLLADGN